MSLRRNSVAAFACILSFALIAPPSAFAAEELERVFVGTPTQLTLPPDFRDEAQPGTGPQAGQECRAPSEQDTSEQLGAACSSAAPVTRSSDDDPSPEAKSLELGNTLAKSGTDTGKSVP